MNENLHDVIKVPLVGTIGLVGTLTLATTSTLVSIAVGLATLAYLLAKLFFLFKNQGKDP